MRRLYLGGIDLAYNSPGRTVREAKQEHGDDDNPSGNAERMDRACGIQGADQEHYA